MACINRIPNILLLVLKILVVLAEIIPSAISSTEKESELCACNGFGVYSPFYSGPCNLETGVCNCNISANVEGDHCNACQASFRNKDGGRKPGNDGCPFAIRRSIMFSVQSSPEIVLDDVTLDPSGQRIVVQKVRGLSTFSLDAPEGVVSSDGVSLSVVYYEVSGAGLPDSVIPLGLLDVWAVSNDSGSNFELLGRIFDKSVELTVSPEASTANQAVYPYIYDSRTKSLEATGLSDDPANEPGLKFFGASLAQAQVVLLSVSQSTLSWWIDDGVIDTGFTPQRNGWPRFVDFPGPMHNAMTLFARWFFIAHEIPLTEASREWTTATLDRLLTLLQVRCSSRPPNKSPALLDTETVRILVHALRLSHSPQIIWMEKEDGFGHAALVYKHRKNDFVFYDPEFGGEGQVLSYDPLTATFRPYRKDFIRFYVYSHLAFQLTTTDMETLYNMTLDDATAPDILLDPFDEKITSSPLTVSGKVVPRHGHPMPALLFSYVVGNGAGGQVVNHGHAKIDSFGHFTKELVDINHDISKIVFVAGGYALTGYENGSDDTLSMQRIRKRGVLDAIGCVLSTVSRLPGYIERKFGRLKSDDCNLLTITLTWNDRESDLNLHILEPEGEHIYDENEGQNRTRFLAKTNTVGLGPEIYVISCEFRAENDTAINDTYLVRVHYKRNRRPGRVRVIRWTVTIKRNCEKDVRRVTGYLIYDNETAGRIFSSKGRSWSLPFKVTLEAVHFIAIADRYLAPTIYHYSAQLWKNVLVLPHTKEESVAKLTMCNPQARKMGEVELLTNCSGSNCEFASWWLHKYVFGRHCWKIRHVTLAFIHYGADEKTGSTQYIPLYIDRDWGKVEGKWQAILSFARNYPHAEQTGSTKINRFPQSIYCLGDDVNNSNTFVRWLFDSVGIAYNEMSGCHPGRSRPRPVPDEYFYGDVFCSSDPPPGPRGQRTCGWWFASPKFKCNRFFTCSDDF